MPKARYYVRRKGKSVLHWMDCQYQAKFLSKGEFGDGTLLFYRDKKPGGCTLCDACQRLEKKAAKK